MLTKEKTQRLSMNTETFNEECLRLGIRVGYLSDISNGWFYSKLDPPRQFGVIDDLSYGVFIGC